jgi:HAD superfamily hydrolase (TIGR01509 family)
MDGVLVDSGAHHRDAWRAMFHDAGLSPPPEFWRVTIGRPADEAVALIVDGLEPAEARRLAAVKRLHYTRLARRGVVPVAGVVAFVEMLVRAGVPRAVATSATRRDLERVLAELGLHRHFDVAVTADDVRRGKPHPEVYLRAAAGLGVDPGACVVFEDAVVGVQAARAAGMRVIGVTSAHTADELMQAGAEGAVPDFAEVRWPV